MQNQTPHKQEHIIALATAKQICNSIKPGTPYKPVELGLYGVVTGAIRRNLGHGKDKEALAVGRINHLKFLSWLFDRDIQTSKIGPHEGITELEGAGIIAWAQPAKLMDEGPWTTAARVKQTCRAFEVVHLGQIEMELDNV